MAGFIISSSSFPINPASPAWGLSANTAIRGFTIPKSCFKEWLNRVNLLTIFGTVMHSAIRETGTCPVTKATRNESVNRIINALLRDSAKHSSKYSVCPGKWKASFWILCLLMGAVSNTSIAPRRKSATAASKDWKAALPASGVDLRSSTFVLSSIQLIIFTRLAPASSAEAMILKFTGGNSIALRW